MYKSLKVCRIDCGLTAEEMTRLTLEVMERNLSSYADHEDLWIVHNISRGGFPPSGDPSTRRSATIIIHTAPLDLRYWAPFYLRGCHAVTPPSRMMPAAALDPKIKNRSRMSYTLAELEVKLVDPLAQGILLDTDGYLTENKGGNFFLVCAGVLYTPRTVNALAGVTRATTLELAEQIGVPTRECDLQPYDVYTAEEAFFTSTPYCLMPATKFNGLPVGDGQVGPITKRLLAAWSDLTGVDVVQQALDQLDEATRAELLAAAGN
jgi:branched-chain amino acid aminotransferase